MKVPLWTFLFLSLCVPGRSDCQGDCLTCGLLLPQHQAFNTLVCLLECESQASPSHTRDLCYQATALNPAGPPPPLQATLSRRAEAETEPLAVLSVEEDGGGGGGVVEYTEALERFRHAAQALGSLQTPDETTESDHQGAFYDTELQPSTEEDEKEEDEDEEEEGAEQRGVEGDTDSAHSASKRFGGFLKGRQGFRKLVSSGRSLQKRYGGFIGIRKSARKWNNQKRVSQLLRHYLSLSARSGRSGRVSGNRQKSKM